MANIEKDISQLIQSMKNQQNLVQKIGGPVNAGGTDQSPYLIGNNMNSSSPDQSPIDSVNSVRPMGTPIYQARKNRNPSSTIIDQDTAQIPGACPQCGSLHPSLPPGVKCPMAVVKIKSNGIEKVVDVNKFLVSLKDIIISQSEIKKVKDVEKLFKNIIVEVTKYLERYKE